MEQNLLPAPEKAKSSRSEKSQQQEEVVYSKTTNDTFVLKNGSDMPGLYLRKNEKDDKKEKDEKTEKKDRVFDAFICGPIRVMALVRDTHQVGYGLLVEFIDMDGNQREYQLRFVNINRDCDSILKDLRDAGLFISTHNGMARKLIDYLCNAPIPDDRRIRYTQRTGWHDNCYMTQSGSFGDTDEDIIYSNPHSEIVTCEERGTLPEWKANVAIFCQNNPLLVFCICLVFATPLLALVGLSNIGFHLVGHSSIGKSTMLKVATSVFGNPNVAIQFWNATMTSMEGTAKAYNDLLMAVDEIGQSVAAHIGEMVYMLGNGMGRGRGNVYAEAKKRAQFRLIFLSNGERTLENHMNESGRKAMAGQEVRMVNIPADFGKYGSYSDIHDHEESQAFNEVLKDNAASYYGTAFSEYLNKLVPNQEKYAELVRTTVDRFVTEHVPVDASGQVKRVAKHFGLAAAAGTLATEMGITGWRHDEAEKAATICFNRWLEFRGGIARSEETNLIDQVRAFFEAHGESRFSQEDENGRTTNNRAGYIHQCKDTVEYLVFPEQFKNEICKGYESKTAIQILTAHGLLLLDKDGKAQISRKIRGEKKNKRMYVFTSKVIEECEADD